MVDHDREAALSEFVGSTRALLARLTEDVKGLEVQVRSLDRAVTEMGTKACAADRIITDLSGKTDTLRLGFDNDRCNLHGVHIKTLMDEREQRRGLEKHESLGWKRVAVIAALIGAVSAACTLGANALDRVMSRPAVQTNAQD